jgi:hypothetical protein
MPEPELLILADIARRLAPIDAPWMLTGSLASNFHGIARSTHDIDLVIELPSKSIRALIEAFSEPEYLTDADHVRAGALDGRMFSIIHLPSGIKLDFWPVQESPFESSKFDRRRPVDYAGVALPIISPEDLILQKLRWAKDSGGSEKQFKDALGVYELRASTLDARYMDHWAMMIGVTDLLQRLRATADPL